MVLRAVRGDILASDHKHIVFGVNTEGANDAGFAGLVASKDWPELAYIGEQPMGRILERHCEGRIYHALVCHSLGEGGWQNTPAVVEQCLNELDVPEGEVIGIVLIGNGFVGRIGGADVREISEAMDRSNKKLIIYYI